ncbi:MAG: DMT family transporter [Azospirillaceae bacterium]
MSFLAAALRAPGQTTGIVLVLVALVSFSASDAVASALTQTMSPLQVVTARFVTALAWLLPFVFTLRRSELVRLEHPVANLVRGLGIFGSAAFFVAALAHLPIATATAIGFVSPFVITLLSIPLLGERVGRHRWAAIAVGFAGVLIVVRPGGAGFTAAHLLPIASATCWAAAIIAMRWTGDTGGIRGTLGALVFANLFGAVAGLMLTGGSDWSITPAQVPVLFAYGFFSILGHGLMAVALLRAAASAIAPFSYTQILWSSAFGFALFGQIPDRWTVLGSAVIVASGLYVFWRERRVEAMPGRDTAMPAAESLAPVAPEPLPAAPLANPDRE